MITLEQAKQLSQDKLTNDVIDEFRQSPLMAALTFDNTVKAQGGSTMAYVFNRITTQPTAGTRAINGEYTAQETTTTQAVANLKVMGGAYEIDRVIQADETQVIDHVKFQSAQKAKATIAVFTDLFINGDSTASGRTDEFDGIDKAIKGSTTDISAASLDMTTADKIKENAQKFLYMLRQLNKNMDGAPTHYLMNRDLYAVFQTVADYVPNVKYAKDDMGNEILKYGPTFLVQMGDKAGTTSPIIADTSPTATNFGETSLYAVRLGMDGVHGVSPQGTSVVKTYLPDFTTPGAVKKGEVEFVGAAVLKSTRAAGVIRNIAVLPKAGA